METKCLESEKYSLNEIAGSLFRESLLPATGQIYKKKKRERRRWGGGGKKAGKESGQEEGSEMFVPWRQASIIPSQTKVVILPRTPSLQREGEKGKHKHPAWGAPGAETRVGRGSPPAPPPPPPHFSIPPKRLSPRRLFFREEPGLT